MPWLVLNGPGPGGLTMKKIALLLIILLLAFSNVQARSLTLFTKTGIYGVEIAMDRNPPILGDNRIEISIKEVSGRPVTDALVQVNYYMPPMPRMAPMNYLTKAKPKGDKYQADMKLIMNGPWIIAVKISANGRMTTARFNIDA
jgi:hypothetical protein